MKAKYIKHYKNKRSIILHSFYWVNSQGIYLIKTKRNIFELSFKKEILKSMGNTMARQVCRHLKTVIEIYAKS